MPLYQLLGGASREAVLVYGHANGKDIERRRRATSPRISIMGYKAIRVAVRHPRARVAPTAWPKGGDALRAGGEGRCRPSTSWSTEAYVEFVPTLFERVRAEFGPELHLLHDVHHRLTPIEAARVGKSLEPYRLLWMEDPVPAELQEGFRLIRQHTTTPIAVGEVFNSIHDCHQLIRSS